MTDKIYGYGKLKAASLDIESVDKLTDDIENRGAFVRKYELADATGGHIISGELQGAMYEYENVFVVVWSCGEYIDAGAFRK